ncbi:MAG: hypothetical protein AMXMBFR51_21160 [Ignavibacteriota bacterium]
MATTRLRSSTQLNIDADLDLNNQYKITNMADPVTDTDAVTKKYVDSVAQGLNFKKSVRAATTGQINLSSPGSTIDGVSLVVGDRVLVKNQLTDVNNGIYIYQGANTPMTRAEDANVWEELVSAFLFVEEGISNADTSWVCLADKNGTLGITPIVWNQFASANNLSAGNGINISGNTISTRLNSDGGLEFFSGEIRVKLDGTTLQRSANGLKVADNTFQPLNARLTSIANMTGNGFLVKYGDSFFARSFQSNSGININNPDGILGNPSFGLDNAVVLFRSDYIINEIPSGAINGVNNNFTTSNTFAYTSVQVFKNGLLQRLEDDYTLSGSDTISFFEPPLPGDSIYVSYFINNG